MEILFIGGSSADIILKIPRFPRPDEKLVVDYATREAGGFIANTACAAAKLGIQTAWAGMLGVDENGKLVKEGFHKFGVDTSLAVIKPEFSTDYTVIMVEPNGRRTILIVSTTPGLYPVNRDFLDILHQVKVVYTQPQPLHWFAQIADTIHHGGGKVAIDVEASTRLKRDELIEVLRKSDLVFCNLRGLKAVSGIEHRQAAARFVLDLGPEYVCVTLGEDGAYLLSQDGEFVHPGYDVPVVDTTGAGDCFHGAFLAAYLRQKPLPEALQFANAAAALSVQKLGPRDGIPDWQQVEEFLGEHHRKGS